MHGSEIRAGGPHGKDQPKMIWTRKGCEGCRTMPDEQKNPQMTSIIISPSRAPGLTTRPLRQKTALLS